MKKLFVALCLASSVVVTQSSWGQGPLGNLLGGQAGDTVRNEVQNSVQGLQNTVQGITQNDRVLPANGQLPNVQLPNVQLPNVQVQGNVTAPLNTRIQGNVSQQGGVRNGQPLNANGSLGAQVLGALRTNLNEHAAIGQDGTVRIRENLNTQMRGLGIQPNDQILDFNGQPIRDVNVASSLFQRNQSIRVNRNGQIVSINPISAQTTLTANALGWGLGSRNNGVYISSLVSNSLAAQAGLRAGDQIVSVNGNPVRGVNDVNAYYSQPVQGQMTIEYLRNGQSGQAIFTNGVDFNEPGVQPPPQPYDGSNMPQSVMQKLDTIEQLLREIRAELSSGR